MSDDLSTQGQEHAMYSVIMGFVVLAIILGGVLYVFSQRNDDEVDTDNDSPTPTTIITPVPTDELLPTAIMVPTVEPTRPLMEPSPTETVQNSVTIDLTGKMHEYSIDEIKVSQGSLVTINFTSTDGFHDFNIDEFEVSTERVNTGGTTSVQFVADQAGTYTYYCSVSNHRSLGMTGTFIVE